MNRWVIKYYKMGLYTKEDLNLFLSVGYLTQDEYNELTTQQADIV